MIDLLDIEEFPYTGKVFRTIEVNNGPDKEEVVYEGKMDVNLSSAEIGKTLQTADYVISMPMLMEEGKYVNHVRKNDKVICEVYGETYKMKVDNYIPSQLGSITVYANKTTF